jgi:enamine deaminase RidA (YjgF/YER057c/UK114 family)
MTTNNRSEAFQYGYVCGRMLGNLVEKAGSVGLTPDEVQTAIRLDRDIKQVLDDEAEMLETAGQNPIAPA